MELRVTRGFTLVSISRARAATSGRMSAVHSRSALVVFDAERGAELRFDSKVGGAQPHALTLVAVAAGAAVSTDTLLVVRRAYRHRAGGRPAFLHVHAGIAAAACIR